MKCLQCTIQLNRFLLAVVLEEFYVSFISHKRGCDDDGVNDDGCNDNDVTVSHTIIHCADIK